MENRCALLAAAAAALVVDLGREELVHGEAHLLEQVAGVVARRAALLGGHAEIVHRHEHLDVAHELYDGEDPDGHEDELAVPSVAEMAAVPFADAVGDVAAAAAAVALAAAVARVHHTGGQDDGVGDLDAAARHVAGGHFLLVVLVGDELAAEDLDVAFTAVQDDLFWKTETPHTMVQGTP